MKRCVAMLFASACCIAACWMFSGQVRAAGQTSDYQARAEHTVENGTYTISTKLSSDMKLDVPGASKANGVKIQIYQGNDTQAQEFYIKDEGKGFYSIQSVSSGKFLDVDSARTDNGNPVHQWEKNGSLAQRWLIEKNGDGSYTFVSALNKNATLDVAGARASNGARLNIYSHNGTKAQCFTLEKGSAYTYPKDGVYAVRSAKNPGIALDIAGKSRSNYGNVQMYQANTSQGQKWAIHRNGDGTYRLYSLLSGKVLEVSNANPCIGANAGQYEYNASLAQKWRFVDLGKGKVAIASALTGQYLDIDRGRMSSGSNVHVWTKNLSDAQIFTLQAADGRSLADGEYAMAVNGNGHHMYAEVRWGERRQGANVQLYQGNGSMGQKFSFAYQGDGFYKITSVMSKHVLDVGSGSRNDDANVQVYGENGSDAQKWIVSENSDGSYSIINANSSKVLDVANGMYVNFGNIHQFALNNSPAQHFILEKTFGTDHTGIDRGQVPYPAVGNFTGLAQKEGRTYLMNHGHVDWNYVGSYQAAEGARWLHVEGGVVSDRDVLTTEEVDAKARAVLNRTGWNLPAAFNYAMVEHYAQRPHHWSFSYYANDGFDHKRGEGNCYTMASMFLAMARQMGYETRQVDGGVPLRRGGVNDHSWVEINVNGTWYICDPDFQQETGRNGYMLHYGQSGTWRYVNTENYMPIR